MAGLIALLWMAAEVLAVMAAGRAVGAAWTLLAFFGTSVVGLLVLRGAGVSMALRMLRWANETAVTEGQVKPIPVADSIPRLVAGLLLVFPGFVTDLAGLVVLLPPLRGIVRRRVHSGLEAQWNDRAELYTFRVRSAREAAARGDATAQGDLAFDIDIEGEVLEPAPDGAATPGSGGYPGRIQLPPPNPRVQ
jgi:UPF0716 protein FxsA